MELTWLLLMLELVIVALLPTGRADAAPRGRRLCC